MGPVADRSSAELDELAWRFLARVQPGHLRRLADRRLDAYLRHHQLGDRQ